MLCLQVYLHDKMHAIAPNLSALIGEVVGARLISHAGVLAACVLWKQLGMQACQNCNDWG